MHKQFNVSYAYTIECSLFAASSSESTGLFVPPRVEFLGSTVGLCLALFFQQDTGDLKLCSLCAEAESKTSCCAAE